VLQQKLFRKSALEKLASPERLDELMKVTSPAGWLAITGIGAILVVVVAWGIFGTISIKVQGKGILIRGGAVLEVSSRASGQIEEILVEPNDVVEEGDEVARVHQPELELRLRNKRAELDDLMRRGGEDRRAQSRILSQLNQQVRDLREKISRQEQLVERGLLTRSTVLNTQQELTSTQQQIAQIQAGLGGRSGSEDDLRRQIAELESQLESSSAVRSPYTGRVIEISTNAGDLVAPGTRILTLEDFSAPIEAVVYVPAADGKKVLPGMPVQISPSTVKAEEWGFMLGEVEDVSEYPVSPDRLQRVLRNQRVVADLTGQSAPIEVDTKLIPAEDTPSGFKWSSSQGPPNQIFSGTLCQAKITVEKKRPVAYVLPIFRKAMGMG
jgi:HlyD family secretion protein